MEQGTDREAMLERGEFEANGFKFTVKPVYLGEEDEYFNDVSYGLYPRKNKDQELTDKDLSHYAMMLFQNRNDGEEGNLERFGLFRRFKRWLAKTFTHNYEYYSDNPSVLGLVKWIERKVFYKGKHIKFYDLERKFNLSKAEIVELFGFFQDLSGF